MSKLNQLHFDISLGISSFVSIWHVSHTSQNAIRIYVNHFLAAARSEKCHTLQN